MAAVRRNELVQGESGNNIGQWHAAIAAQSGSLTVAWDDDRDGSSDSWISWRPLVGVRISPFPGRSGPALRSAMVLDAGGNLHRVWIEQQCADAATGLCYSEGRRETQNSGTPRVH
jgi:hypothetical protein